LIVGLLLKSKWLKFLLKKKVQVAG
jgi:hypothetical protein